MFLGTVDQHYNRLYNAKHFRNRIIRIQKLWVEFKYDAVLLVVGIDTYHDKEMKKFKNWLFYGISGYDMEGTSLNDNFNDSFCVISKDSFQAYTTTAGFKDLSRLSALVPNRNIYWLTKEEEENQELNEVKKIAKFYEMVWDKGWIGLPAREIKLEDTFINELQMIEKWPICQSYGLDLVGEGFFTMKHQVKNIREQLNIVYREYDSFAVYAVMYDEIPKTGHYFYDSFYTFLKGTPQKRLDTSEKELIEALSFRYEFGEIGKEEHKREDGLPVPRTLFGLNTNLENDSISSDIKLWKYGQKNDRIPVHMTIEYVERRTSLRFARTYMLSNWSINYMKGYEQDGDSDSVITK